MADWKKIKAEYVQGGTSQRKLVAKYGVSLSSISRASKREKWAELRKQAEDKANAKIVNSVAEREAKRVDEFVTIADMLMEIIKEGLADKSLLTDSQSLRHIAATLKDLREIKGCRNELDLEEQKARIEKLRKEAKEDEASQEIKVVIEKDLEDYAN